MSSSANSPSVRLLSRPELKTLKGFPFSNPTLLRLEKAGKFPPRFYLTSKTSVWKESDIDNYIKERELAQEEAIARQTAPATAARTSRRRIPKVAG